VLKTVEKQDSKVAEKLGLKDIKMNKQDRFSRKEDNLEEEIVQAEKLLDRVAQELKEKKLIVTPELQKDLALLEKAVSNREAGAVDRIVSPVDSDARAGKKEHNHWAVYKGHMITEEEPGIITSVEAV
jgi:hypothetical protein